MRVLTLSVGNTSLFGGVFTNGKLGPTFRSSVEAITSSPSALSRNSRRVERIVLCSVVPSLTASVVSELEQRFRVSPQLLTSASAHGLRIGYRQPQSLGTDRLAAALGARTLVPGDHVIVVDCGTATTVTALHRDGTLLGGAIFPGLALWPEMLAARTAQLPKIDLRIPATAVGRSTKAGIAAGVFFGHVGAIRELVTRVRQEAFGRSRVTVIGTGGHASRFRTEKIFDTIEPALVLHGLRAFAEQAADL